MLQRAASNAYSWWWASHIRTKQSKWMEQNLQDMEEKVQNALKLIEEDGDSFAKRAEMYYKKRPELIHFVEESYRAYRALAERYDHISTELQNANTTIASVFPDQVQFAMEEEDGESSTPKFLKKPPPEAFRANIPKVPKTPIKDLKGVIASATKERQPKRPTKTATIISAPKSGLSKTDALEEIDKLQKQILALQTIKEFAKSSYESGLARYWDVENQIVDMQERISCLQEEFGAGIVIEDEEARTLMAEAALKSCQEMLTQLHEKQARSAEEALVESGRIQKVRETFESLKVDFLHGHEKKSTDQRVTFAKSTDEQEKELGVLRDKIKQHFEAGSNASLTVTELAEKIDDLVHKVISLETAISSQTALIVRLRTETNDLQVQIQTLEDDKAMLVDGKTDMSSKLKQMEEKLYRIQDLNSSVEDQKKNLQTHFTEAECNLNHLSEKLHTVKPDDELDTPVSDGHTKLQSQEQERMHSLEELNNSDPFGKKLETPTEVSSPKESIEEPKLTHGSADTSVQTEFPTESAEELKLTHGEVQTTTAVSSPKDSREEAKLTSSEAETSAQNEVPRESTEDERMDIVKKETSEITKENDINLEEDVKELKTKNDPENMLEEGEKEVLPHKIDDLLLGVAPEEVIKQEDEPDWKELYMNGMENREKVLLTEYTSVLRNYKDVKKKLTEVEKKPGDTMFDVMLQLKQMKNANAKKEEQIQLLRQKLSLLQTGFGDDSLSEKATVTEIPLAEPIEERDLMEDIKVILLEQSETSEVEDRFRMSIDELLEENLNFWLRFSTSFHEIQKFDSEVKDLQGEISTIEEKRKKHEGSSALRNSLSSDVRPLYKHLRQIQTELTVWLEKSVVLKEELNSRFSSLCEIQEEITTALKASAEDDDFKFTSYQAAKFQGEVLNMKQENNKVADELQAGLDHVTNLQLEVEKTMAKLSEDFGLSGSKNHQNIQLEHTDSHSRVPLRSFIFGVRARKQKHSIFSYMHPGLHRKYNGLRSGLH